MAEFCITIAGHTGKVTSLFESTPQYCKAYLTDNTPEFTVTVTREDLAFEQNDLREEALRDGFKLRTFPDPFLERAAIQRRFAEFLFDRNTLLVHGSALAVDGNGYLFTAASGTGKSTHTRLWMQMLPGRAVMINDDKPFLQLTPHGIWLHGSPWSGKHGLDTNITVPLKGMCLLERGSENRIAQASVQQLLPMVAKGTYQPLDPGKSQRFSDLVMRLCQAVPLWHMTCNPHADAAKTAYDAMC